MTNVIILDNFGSLISILLIEIMCDLKVDLYGEVMSGQAMSTYLFS